MLLLFHISADFIKHGSLRLHKTLHYNLICELKLQQGNAKTELAPPIAQYKTYQVLYIYVDIQNSDSKPKFR